MPFKYSLNTNILRHDYSVSEIIEVAKQAEVDGIEWGLPKLPEVSNVIGDMVKATQDAGLATLGFLNGGKLWKIDELTQWADVVAEAGGKSLRVAHPWIAFNYNEALHQGQSWMEIFDLCKGAMPKVEAIAKERNMQFVLEMHMGSLTASSLSAMRVLEGVDPKAVGVIYDVANCVYEGFLRPRNDVEILGDHLAYVHAKNLMWTFSGDHREGEPKRAQWEHKVVKLDAGIVDWVEVMFALKVGGFNGWISMEEFFSKETPVPDLKEGLAFLRACETAAPDKPQEPFLTLND